MNLLSYPFVFFPKLLNILEIEMSRIFQRNTSQFCKTLPKPVDRIGPIKFCVRVYNFLNKLDFYHKIFRQVHLLRTKVFRDLIEGLPPRFHRRGIIRDWNQRFQFWMSMLRSANRFNRYMKIKVCCKHNVCAFAVYIDGETEKDSREWKTECVHKSQLWIEFCLRLRIQLMFVFIFRVHFSRCLFSNFE